MNRTETAHRIALATLADTPRETLAPTTWHGLRQVVTRNGVAVAALVPLSDLQRLEADGDPDAAAPHPRADPAAPVPAEG